MVINILLAFNFKEVFFMAGTNFPQGTGLGAYLKITSGFEIFQDNADNEAATRAMKGVARLVATHIAIPYFAKGGIFYNMAAFVGNAVMGVLQANDSEQSIAHFKDCGRNIAYISIDVLTLFSSPVITLGYTIFPNQMIRYYEQITGIISGEKAILPPVHNI
jgi:hypothetical protein